MFARLFILLQYILPRFWLTSLVYRLARIRTPAVKNFLISGFVRLYKVPVDEVKLSVPDDFETLNDFFVRELETDARPVDKNPLAIVSPVDDSRK